VFTHKQVIRIKHSISLIMTATITAAQFRRLLDSQPMHHQDFQVSLQLTLLPKLSQFQKQLITHLSVLIKLKLISFTKTVLVSLILVLLL